MAIKKRDLSEMNSLLSQGETIAQIRKKYPKYGYGEIHKAVDDFSFLGKKRTISNHLKKIATEKTAATRHELAKETKMLLDELYNSLKSNSRKLVSIEKILRKNN